MPRSTPPAMASTDKQLNVAVTPHHTNCRPMHVDAHGCGETEDNLMGGEGLEPTTLAV
ncbi:MAG: hypothetical protein JWN40_2039 [Phycisphaerales bacterium]|nr:hypothetical protein [Phycisphaerales bacterium]